MTDSLKLDSDGVRQVVATVSAASTAAAQLAPIGLDDSCVTIDFRGTATELSSVWRAESTATATYLLEYMDVLRKIADEMSLVEAELAREAGTP